MRRLNKTSRNFRGKWQVELLQQGRLRWQFSKMLSEGTHSSIQGFYLGENWLFCYALNPVHLCCQYMVLTPRWHLRRGMPEWVQSSPLLGKNSNNAITINFNYNNYSKTYPPTPSFLGEPWSLSSHLWTQWQIDMTCLHILGLISYTEGHSSIHLFICLWVKYLLNQILC